MTRSHKDWITEIDECGEYDVDVGRKVQVHPHNPDKVIVHRKDGYEEWMDKAAYDAMCEPHGTMTHAANACGVLKGVLREWCKRHPSLRKAIIAGRQVGEEGFRKNLEKHAYNPSKDVNNGLIKLLAANVHGIEEAPAFQIVTGPTTNVVNTDDESAKMFAEALGREISSDSEDDKE